MDPAWEFGLEHLNSNRSQRSGLAYLSSVGLLLLGLAVYFRALPFVGLSRGLAGQGSVATSQLDAAVLGFFGLCGALVLAVGLTSFPELATKVSGDNSGWALEYPSGRVRRFSWTDPRMKVTIADVVPLKGPGAGQRRIIVWLPPDRSALSVPAFERLCADGKSAGASIERREIPGRPGEAYVDLAGHSLA